MIEEIKKEIEEQSYNENFCTKIIQLDDLYKILDKHNNQQTLVTLKDFENVSNKLIDYKSAWEELKNLEIGEDEKGNKYYFKSDGTMEELEQKYNLGGE